MALSDEMNERIGVLLENLGTVRAKLNGRAQGFVDDQIARHDKYGHRMFLSEKQLDWLESLHKEHCPGVPLPPGELQPDDDGDPGPQHPDVNDMDDDIPF
jgi:hypothetical protein